MSVPRDHPDSPRPMGVRLVVDFTTGRIVGAERPAAPAPPVRPGERDDAPPTLEAA